jgi:GT2 family glycosyltransferase
MACHSMSNPSLETELISVVIANYNRRDDLREALLSVLRQDYATVEVIVVDNASTDRSVAMLTAEFPQVKVVASPENLGMDGYSLGFRQARGKYIFQMDNDSEMPEPTVLSEVVRRFRQGPENLAVVATRVVDLRGMRPNVQDLRRDDPRVGPIDYAHYHAGGVGFLRSALDQVGYYNRDVFLYCAESFVEIRFLALGFAVLTYPEIIIFHKGSPTARSKKRFLFFTLRNNLWYLRCFATGWQKVRYIPQLLLYYFARAIFKFELGTYLRAAFQGVRPLPQSLNSITRSDRLECIRRVDAVASYYTLAAAGKTFFSRVRAVFAR